MNLFGSLRSRVITGLALLFVLFLTLAALGIGSLRSQARAMDVELDFLIRSSALATDMVSRVGEQIRAAEGYLSEPTPELGRELIRLGDSSHVLRRRYRLLPGLSPRDQAILNRLSLNQARLEVAYATAHAYRDLGRLAEARAAADGARAPGDTLMAQVRALTRSQEARVDARVEAFRGQVADRQAIVYVLVALAIALGGGAAYLTVRSIDAPLQELIESARRFGEGDLRPAQLGAMPRELATLAQAMGTMGSRLRSVIDSTVRESRGISLSAGDLSAMSEELAASSHEIVKAVGGVTASAEQQVLEVRNAEGLLARLREASAQDLTATERVVALGEASRALSARHGTDLTAAADALALLRDEVRRAAQEARELGRFIARVSEIRDLAQQLASESDVLALNASVEAARGTEGVSGGGGGEGGGGKRRRVHSGRRGDPASRGIQPLGSRAGSQRRRGGRSQDRDGARHSAACRIPRLRRRGNHPAKLGCIAGDRQAGGCDARHRDQGRTIGRGEQTGGSPLRGSPSPPGADRSRERGRRRGRHRRRDAAERGNGRHRHQRGRAARSFRAAGRAGGGLPNLNGAGSNQL